MNRREAIRGMFAGAAVLAASSLIQSGIVPQDDSRLLLKEVKENKVVKNRTFVLNKDISIELSGHTITNCSFRLLDGAKISFRGNHHMSSITYCNFVVDSPQNSVILSV